MESNPAIVQENLHIRSSSGGADVTFSPRSGKFGKREAMVFDSESGDLKVVDMKNRPPGVDVDTHIFVEMDEEGFS